MHDSSIFHQFFNFIPRHRFENAVKNTSGDLYCKHFTAWKQFLTLLYARISGKDSLREIENGLPANYKRLYHPGMGVVPKSTSAEAMNRRSPEIFKKLFEELLDRTMQLAVHHKFKFNNPLHAIDTTSIDLCLTKPDSIYTFDKGYCDRNWFKHISDEGAFFVTRIKNNAQIKFLGQHREGNEKLGIIRDDVICSTGYQTSRKYPGKPRLVEFYDEENDKYCHFITNNFSLAASGIAGICQQRRQIELFFSGSGRI